MCGLLGWYQKVKYQSKSFKNIFSLLFLNKMTEINREITQDTWQTNSRGLHDLDDCRSSPILTLIWQGGTEDWGHVWRVTRVSGVSSGTNETTYKAETPRQRLSVVAEQWWRNCSLIQKIRLLKCLHLFIRQLLITKHKK